MVLFCIMIIYEALPWSPFARGERRIAHSAECAKGYAPMPCRLL